MEKWGGAARVRLRLFGGQGAAKGRLFSLRRLACSPPPSAAALLYGSLFSALLGYIFEDLLGVDFCLYFLGGEDFLDDAFFVDKVGGAQDADGAAPAGHLFAPAAELLQEGGLGVGYQGEVEAVGLGKLLLQGFFVLAHAYNGIACGFELGLVCLQRTGLGRATGGVGFGVAVEDEFAAAEPAALYFVAVLVGSQDFGDAVSYVHGLLIL